MTSYLKIKKSGKMDHRILHEQISYTAGGSLLEKPVDAASPATIALSPHGADPDRTGLAV